MPENTIEPLGSLSNIANPFNPQDINPVLVPQALWTRTTDLVIFHGRRVCDARRPNCAGCPVRPSATCCFRGRASPAPAMRPAPRAGAMARAGYRSGTSPGR
jgi:hypothetical protein